jgi:hypothetical protein
VLDAGPSTSVCLKLRSRQVTALEVNRGTALDVGRDKPDPSARPHRPDGVAQQGASPIDRHVLDHVVGVHVAD